MEPRATPEARLALGAAFLRAVRFSFLRSVFSVTVLVFISSKFSSDPRIVPPASSIRGRERVRSILHPDPRPPDGLPYRCRTWGALLLYLAASLLLGEGVLWAALPAPWEISAAAEY